MALQTLKSVKLTNSRAIKKGISNKNVGVLSDELKKQQRKGNIWYIGHTFFENIEMF